MITTFFRNQMLPALKNFSNEDVCAWRETRAHTYGRTKFCSQAPFHRRFLQRFLRKTRSVRILRREFTKRKRPNSASQNFIPKIFAEIFARGAKRKHARTERTKFCSQAPFHRRFLQRFLRVARNASTHERAHKILLPSSFSSKIFAEIFAQDKKCADFATGIYKT